MLEVAYGGVSALLAALVDEDLSVPSRCDGWRVRDVLAHLLMDAERALVACATPHPGPPTVDAVTYWQPAVGADGHAEFVRVQASAYAGVAGLRAHWDDTSGAAVRAVADRRGCVQTQGLVLTVADLADTLVVEAVVHHLDCLLQLPGPRPHPAAAAATRRSLEAVHGSAPGSDEDAILTLTGRN